MFPTWKDDIKRYGVGLAAFIFASLALIAAFIALDAADIRCGQTIHEMVIGNYLRMMYFAILMLACAIICIICIYLIAIAILCLIKYQKQFISKMEDTLR